MSTNNFETRFQNLIDANFELVEEYNNTSNNIPLEYAFDDIIDAYIAYKAIYKDADFASTIKNALHNAIKYEQNIVDAIISMTLDNEYEYASNSIQQYFKEVGDIYNRNNNNSNFHPCIYVQILY